MRKRGQKMKWQMETGWLENLQQLGINSEDDLGQRQPNAENNKIYSKVEE